MEKQKTMKTGYSIRTWRMHLFCPEPAWLELTEEYFQEVVDFYYTLLKDHPALWTGSLFDIQRTLEIMTLAGRDGRVPQHPLPLGKVPVYLRRAAINKAASTVKSVLAAKEPSDTSEHLLKFPENLESNVTFFKGMYSDITSESIRLKLWNGKKWVWLDCRLKGRQLPADGQVMSPTLVKEGRYYMLHIPVKQENADGRTAKERMAESTRLCSIRFTNTDTFALCCVLDEEGETAAVHACRGGKEYRHRCEILGKKIRKSRPNTDQDNVAQPNRKYYLHLKNLSDHYAHQVSREILNFCLREKAKVIVLPDYEPSYTRMAMVKSGNYSPLHLSSRIRSYLQYKAWSEGIIVLELRTDGLKDKCAICQGKIRRKGSQFLCENGHQGSRFLNDARNLGQKCQDSFQKALPGSPE